MNAVSEASAAFPYHLPLTDCSLEEATLQQRAAEQHTHKPAKPPAASRRQGCREEGTGDVQKLPVPLFIIFAKDCLDLFIPAPASFLPSPLSISAHPAEKQPVVSLRFCTGLR